MRWFQTLLAVAAAVAPILGVFIWGWSVRDVVFIYWAENVIIGFWQVMKMGLVGFAQTRQKGAVSLIPSLFTMLFFTVHYGGFCLAHGLFVLTLTNEGIEGSTVEWKELTEVPRESLWSVASIFALKGLGVWQDFVETGRWKQVRPNQLMGEPYRYIIILHIAIVLGAGLVMRFEGAWPVLALIVLGKLVVDLCQIWREKKPKSGQKKKKGATE